MLFAVANPAPALADGPPDEKARSLVATLRKGDDEAARRDLFALGASSLAPLAEALEREADPAAAARLTETFEGVLKARLMELDVRLSRQERAREALTRPRGPSAVAEYEALIESAERRLEEAKKGQAEHKKRAAATPETFDPETGNPVRAIGASDKLAVEIERLDAEIQQLRDRAREAAEPLLSPADAAAQVAAIANELRGAGYAASRELAREGGARDEFAVAARMELLGELLDRVRADAAADGKALTERLANLGPLAASLIGLVLENPADKAVHAPVAKAGEVAVARAAALLAGEDDALRRLGEERLYGMGAMAKPALERLAAEGGPDERHRAGRLLLRIEWGIAEELYRRCGHLLQGFAKLPWRDRRMAAYELEKQGGVDSVPALRRILETEQSVGVRVAAAEALARENDPLGFKYLRQLGMAPLVQSPEIVAGIAADQGIRYLQIRRYEKAIEEFMRVLEVQPQNDVAHYNLACAYALRYARDGSPADKERAFEYLEKSTKLGFEDDEHIEKDSDLESLRSDPRFHAIVERLRLKKAGEKSDR